MSWPNRFARDARVLLRLLRGQPRGGTHAQRLQHFYGPQADDYDRFRERLLHGRAELVAELIEQLGAALPGSFLLELGGGTGRNLEFFGSRLAEFARVELVDLCPALLDRARARTAQWPNTRIIEADATDYQPDRAVDAVLLSYALSMIPDWRGAIDNALAALRPGGLLGAVDFYVSVPEPPPGQRRHSPLTRWFWPRWFGHDGVHLDPERLCYLQARCPRHRLVEAFAPVPYLPGLRVPYYRFIGSKAD